MSWTSPLVNALLGLCLLFSGLAQATQYVDDFRVTDFNQPAGQANPMVCMQFNYELDATYPHPEDFVLLQARPLAQASAWQSMPVSIQHKANNFCLRDLNHGSRYELTFRDGMPLSNQQAVSKPYIYSFSIGDRDPEFKFQTATYILPSNQNARVPVKVVNLHAATVSVYRLSPEQVKDSMQSEQFFESYRGWSIDRLAKSAQFIGKTELNWQISNNQSKRINLDLSEVLHDHPPGAYVLHADTGQDRWSDQDVQTLIYTDIGLTTYQGNDGLSVYARSYQTGLPKAGIQVDLVAKNHDLLDTAFTNAQGKVVFDATLMQGQFGHQPVQVRHLGDSGEYAVLNLTGQQLDMSDRPVDGAPALTPLNAYLFSERGVYRLGETLVLTAMVRDESLKAVGNMPLTLKLIRPSGDVAVTRSIYALNHGGFQQRLSIPSSGRTGQWQAALFLNPQEAPIGKLNFEVADYVPETIKVVLHTDNPTYSNDATQIEVQSDFLYGAPASNLEVTSQAIVKQQRRLFDQYKGYVFGSAQAFSTDVSRLDAVTTDASGLAQVKVPNNLLQPAWQQQALVMNLRVEVKEPSNRVATRNIQLAAIQLPSWVGIKTQNDYPVYDRNKPVVLNLANITSAQQPIAGADLRYTLIQENWDYHWYYTSSRWRYKVSKFDQNIVQSGNVITNAAGLASIDFGIMDWGRYRLEVTDVNSNQTTQLAFRNGWWHADGSQSATPDNVKLAPAVKSLQVGDSLALKVEAPYAGQLHLLVANDHIIEEHLIDLSKATTELQLEAKAEWGQGVYFIASVYRPGKEQVGPARAIGITHVKVERPQLHTTLSIHAPEQVRPNEQTSIHIDTNLPAGSPVVLAAVDEGILQLTRYQTPNPGQWFLQKRRLGLGIRDLYGHLIQHKDGELLKLRFGGDSDGGAPTAPPMDTFVKPVAIVSGLVPVDDKGKATVDITFPQFNGQVRLMAVAFDDLAMGATSEAMLVRYPLVVQPSLPRFLAQGDTAEIGVSVHNIELPAGQEISLEWQATEGLILDDAKASIALGQGQRKTVSARVRGQQIGNHRLGLTVKVKGKTPQVYTWDLTVVQNRFIETHYQQTLVAPGERTTLLSLVGDLNKDSRHMSLQATDKPSFDTGWLTDSLSRYPFGCLEQTTSKAWPILILNGSASNSDEASNKQKKHLDKAIQHLASMQLRNGSFSLWRGGSRSEEWLTMYAAEFLLEANKLGYAVPQHMLEGVRSYVQRYRGDSVASHAYAYYLRAKMGVLDPGDLRYLISKVLRNQYRPQVYSHLLLAADMIGQETLVNKLLANTKLPKTGYWYREDYSSYLRDAAMLSHTLLVIAKGDATLKEKAYSQMQELFKEAQDKRWLSTQEKAWLIRLADQLGQAKQLAANLPVTIDFRDMALADVADYLVQQDNWSSFKNASAQAMYLSFTATGVQQEQTSAASHNGVVIKTQYTHMGTGENMSLDKVTVGTEVLVSHKINLTQGADVELSLEAPVPAGFELENPRLTGLRTQVSDLPRTEPSFEQFRDDRYMAAWSLPNGFRSLNQGESTIAYVMRAVTPGEYLVPAAIVEDMYRPENRANTAEGRVIILPQPNRN